MLAESLDSSPAYARARLAAELRAVLAELRDEEREAAEERERAKGRTQRQRQGRWAESERR